MFTGLRPGEKMYEALVTHDERLMRTDYDKIMVIEPQGANGRDIFEDMKTLERIVEEGDMGALFGTLKDIVPNYEPGVNNGQR